MKIVLRINKSLLIIVFIIITACASQKSSTSSNAKSGDSRTKAVKYLDDNTYLLTDVSTDKTYAFKQTNPVKVGRDGGSGPQNERRFINALLGPNGEQIKYYRSGSCCLFKTPNGLINNTGLLDVYRIHWTGAKDTLDIYINMYDKGDLQIPVGLTAKGK